VRERPFTSGAIVRDNLKKEASIGRSLAADRRRNAKTKVPKGQGDRGETE